AAQKPFAVHTSWAAFRRGPLHQGKNPFENVINPSNAADLGLLWRALTGDIISFSSPAVTVANRVYIGSFDGKLYAFNATTGACLGGNWQVTTDVVIFSSPAVANGVVYVGSLDHKLYAFNATTGASLGGNWPVTTGDSIFSSPAAANGVVYVGSL